MIDCVCPHCGNQYSLNPESVGKTAKCVRCSRGFTVQEKPMPKNLQTFNFYEPVSNGFLLGLGFSTASSIVGLVLWGVVSLLRR
jgi:predicted Zn finger-like uncharacterized protein